MKKFNSAKITLFDSTAAFFKLSVDAMFTKKRHDNTLSSLAYITDAGNARINPNIYLVLTYKTDNYETTKSLYTSYPQLYYIRTVMNQVSHLLTSGEGFKEVEGMLTVNPNHKTPLIISEIGQKNKWISFSLMTTLGADGVTKIPAVSIELSDANGYVSILTVEEFLTVQTIINDLDLTAYQITLSQMYLMAEYTDQGGSSNSYNSNYKQNNNYQNNNQQPQQNYQRNYQQNYNKPRYNNMPYNQQNQQQQPQQRAPQQNQQQQPQQRAPQPQQNNFQQPQQSSSYLGKRREEDSIVNLKNVENIEVASVDLNDDAAIENIFSDDN